MKFKLHKPLILAFWLSFFLPSGCAVVPDNWAFTKEVIQTDKLSQVNRVALLDVPPPKNIILGDQFSDSAVNWFGFVGMLTVEDTEGQEITSGGLVSETTQNELRKWLELAGIEVVLVRAERENKSKMLSSYEQFSQVDADAILEVAPVEVGFQYKVGEIAFRKSKQDLSPDVFFKYRLVSAKTGEVLVESNVTYSSFNHYHGLGIKGEKLIGPKEHILDDEDFVREQPAEAVRRLKHAIKGATESIAKTVTNQSDTIPMTSATFTGDFTGTYKSEITYTKIFSLFNPRSYFGKRPEVLVKIDQTESNIEGILIGSRTGELKGTVNGNKIEFDFTVQPPGVLKQGNGVWVLDDVSGLISGEWEINYGAYHLAGEWNLIKIE